MPAYKQISLKMSKETYEKIMDRYAKCPYAISLNKFIVRCAAEYEPIIIRHNYDAIRDHSKEITRIKNLVWSVVAMLTSTGQATKKDVETIVSLLETIAADEKKLHIDFNREHDRLTKLIKNEAKALQKIKKDGA